MNKVLAGATPAINYRVIFKLIIQIILIRGRYICPTMSLYSLVSLYIFFVLLCHFIYVVSLVVVVVLSDIHISNNLHVPHIDFNISDFGFQFQYLLWSIRNNDSVDLDSQKECTMNPAT